ncbi:uncharacterized protein AruCF_1741 [Achromobacter ruhlandii]|nr:uncharacterized protein AruCF_1741 [Achromobacter ruhlandii]
MLLHESGHAFDAVHPATPPGSSGAGSNRRARPPIDHRDARHGNCWRAGSCRRWRARQALRQ